MHPVILFNKNGISCNYGDLKINQLRSYLTENMIIDGYFYIQWFFPVLGNSKWHTHTPEFKLNDLNDALKDNEVLNNVLVSAKKIISIFDLNIINNEVIYIANFRKEHNYWLRGIGHEEKKISRIALSLYYLGYEEISKLLISKSIEILKTKGFKTKKDTSDVINYWESIFDKKMIY